MPATENIIREQIFEAVGIVSCLVIAAGVQLIPSTQNLNIESYTRYKSRKLYTVLLCTLISLAAYSQAQLVIGDGGSSAYINISGGACLTIGNSSSNAIVQNSGWIISEGENNRVQWNIGSSTGTYTLPWGYSTSNYIPQIFTISSAGTADGKFIFSTYRTGSWQNSSYLPSGITHVGNSSVSDASAYIADRFWSIDASGYTTKPSLTNLVFTYADDGTSWEVHSSNTITESSLQAQRWNSSVGDWEYSWINGTASAASNSVSISSVAASDLHKWWCLIDPNTVGALPIELLYFRTECINGSAQLSWSTASETNSDYFLAEKSFDTQTFAPIATVQGAGNSSTQKNYQAADTEQKASCYYRLKQVDKDGSYKYYPLTLFTGCNSETTEPEIWSSGNMLFYKSANKENGNTVLSLYDMQGRLLRSEVLSISEDQVYQSELNLMTGIYLAVFTNRNKIFSKKINLD